jgi:hypothetical protein
LQIISAHSDPNNNNNKNNNNSNKGDDDGSNDDIEFDSSADKINSGDMDPRKGQEYTEKEAVAMVRSQQFVGPIFQKHCCS